MPPTTPPKRSAMYHHHLDLGAVMVESDGWQRPARYESAEDEVEHLKTCVGLWDISPVDKLSLQGTDLHVALAGALGANGLPAPGLVSRKELDESSIGTVTISRLASDEAMIFTQPGKSVGIVDAFQEITGRCAHIVDVSSALTGISITGPLAPNLLAAVTELDTSLDSFGAMSCAQGKIAEVYGLLLRLELAALPNYEVYVSREYGAYAWEALLEAARDYNGVPVGMEAITQLSMNRPDR